MVVIVIVDELAELYLVASRADKDEALRATTNLLRLAQLGAALGVHLIRRAHVGLTAALCIDAEQWKRLQEWQETPGQARFLMWGGRDLNPRPRDYESPALTS